jgi:hypothetical protein
MEKTWFEFKEIRKRRLGDAVWIPLCQSEYLLEKGEWGYVGYAKEFYGVGAVAIPRSRREQAKKLRWSDLGGHNQGVWATKDHYKPAEVFQYNDKEDLGTELVLIQTLPTDDHNEWHLNQDLVFAFGLKREGDVWLKADEDYVEVVRLRRNQAGEPIAIEIKNDFLRDYLCARDMFLRTSMYRERAVVVVDAKDAGSPVPVNERSERENFEIRVTPMVEGGHFGDATFAVFHVSRTDVDPDEDVPTPGPESNENTKSESFYGKHQGRQLTYITGKLWRDENIEPGPNSVRVRRDNVPTGLNFIMDATGTRTTSEELDNEDIGRWLWFRPEVIPAITGRRSGQLTWYTMDTGAVGFSGNLLTHFGINKLGQINVYAYDIARMPWWVQQVWAGFNIVPEGGVSTELLASQMRAEPAHTMAPEKALPQIMTSLDEAFFEAIGAPLFRPHAESAAIMAGISRFRALTHDGLFALAKDLMRAIADQINTTALQKVVSPPKNEKWGSLKSVERFLATLTSIDAARQLMGPLFGAYDLRVADAHMPTADLNTALSLVHVSLEMPPLTQGFRLIAVVAHVLNDIGKLVRERSQNG